VTQRGTRSQDVFFSDDDRRQYLLCMRECAERYGVKVLSWCLMTNHVHFSVVPAAEGSLALCFGTAHKRYSRMVNFRSGWRGFLFQGRFGSSPMDPAHTYHALRYILRNPVRAGMVRVPWRYEWSSAAYHVGETKTDVLASADEGIEKMVGNWRTFLAEPDADEYLCRIRRESLSGRPLGDDAFITGLENALKRNFRRGRPGRPRKRPSRE
jgi:putative transposase